jgi:hypothetical protein
MIPGFVPKVLTGVLLVYLGLNLPAQSKRAASRITGTYTNLEFNKEGGDLLGEELRIVNTRSGYQGVFQNAEGGAGELILVKIKLAGNKIEFAVPDLPPLYAVGQLSGTIAPTMIRFSDEDILKKGQSYWEFKGKPQGIYTNMHDGQARGSVLGEELRIVYTDKGYQGMLQIASGEPGAMVIVPVKMTGNKIEFTVPNLPPMYTASRFFGTIDPMTIRGQFTYQNGVSREVVLKKGKSYWD